MSATLLFLAPAATISPLFTPLKEEGLEPGLAESLRGALALIQKRRPALVFSRPRMSGYRVEELLAEAEGEDSFPPVIIITDKGSPDEAQRYMELGAHDYWLEPLDADKIIAAVPRGEPATAAQKKSPGKVQAFDIIGKHPVVSRVLALARQVAPSKATVLISGESGTGKEMFARFLHVCSDRAQGPFVAVNCAALPEHLLESELFGHEKGAFTGAIARKPGKFELAHGGTILLDEISEMDLGLQAKLLRVLQEGELDRVGGTETVKVDVRVLATTNRSLQEWVEAGKFRQDLYFRLNVIPLKLPPLRERGEDILLLAHFFVHKFCKQYDMPRLDFAPEATDWLRDYQWPGNVRELQNLMERAVLLAGRGPINTMHFLLDDDSWSPEMTTQEVAEEEADGDAAPSPFSGEALEHMLGGKVIPLQEMERIMIMRGLEQTSGNRTQAAELLGISVRTLRNKLNEYRTLGLDIP
ncbi:sigma-54 dependent transcriptional regulator [Megalodesulfovibrio paquesii]